MKRWMFSLLPEFIIGIALTLVVTCFFWGSDNYKNNIVSSDGRGYYAFLPATIIQKDLSFKETSKVERTELDNSIIPFYLIENEKGQTFNKYYPGVAVMQLPFFLVALVIESTYADTITGYSLLFLKIFQLGSIFYLTLGFFFLRRFLEITISDKRSALLASVFIFIGTNLFFIVIVRTSFSHHFSFCLFAAFAYFVRRYFDSGRLKHVIWIGLVLGLIVLVRPLNILVILAIPLILLNWKNVQVFFKQLFKLRNGNLGLSFGAFLGVLSLLFILNFLQTGNILNWSYHGEGFNFGSPHFWTILFSYRIGLFVHTPLLFLCLFGCYQLYKKHKQAAIFWFSYLAIITYIMSCWWSWDYGGFYGNRVFTEHLVFFALPLAYFFQGARFTKLAITVASIFTLFMWSRAYQIMNEITPSRFTRATYFQSAFQMGTSMKNDFAFNRDVKPFGEFSSRSTLISTDKTPLDFNNTREFGLIHEFRLPKEHAHNRYYFTIELKKTLKPTSDLKDVFLVMDWHDTITNHREYHSIPLYEYYKESPGVSDEMILQQEQYLNPINELNRVNIYVWNPQHKEFSIDEFELTVEEYVPYRK
jgi:hypothetical protein